MVPANTSPLPVLGDSFFPRRPTTKKVSVPKLSFCVALVCALFSAFPSTRYLGVSQQVSVISSQGIKVLLSSPFANLVKRQICCSASLLQYYQSCSRSFKIVVIIAIAPLVGERIPTAPVAITAYGWLACTLYGSSGPCSRRRLSWVRKGP